MSALLGGIMRSVWALIHKRLVLLMTGGAVKPVEPQGIQSDL